MKDTYPVDGEKLRRMRHRRILDQEQLAKRASLSKAHLSSLERKGGGVHAKTLQRLAAALDVEPHEILRNGWSI